MTARQEPPQLALLVEKLRWLRLPGMAAAVKDLIERAAKDNLTPLQELGNRELVEAAQLFVEVGGLVLRLEAHRPRRAVRNAAAAQKNHHPQSQQQSTMGWRCRPQCVKTSVHGTSWMVIVRA